VSRGAVLANLDVLGPGREHLHPRPTGPPIPSRRTARPGTGNGEPGPICVSFGASISGYTDQNKRRSMAHGNCRTSNGTRHSRGGLRNFLLEGVRETGRLKLSP
jgi:hypothetical protein